VPEDEADATVADVRKRDEARFELQMVGDIYSGRDLMRRNVPTPTPLTPPRRAGKVYGREEAERIATKDDERIE
jgi:glutathione-regulated potassium-efflux system protein KefB